ncbi:linear amide C-N hydrolase [Geomicrobium sp. JCM 19039]
MCTAATVNMKDRNHFLARNFDFYDLPTDYQVYILPRNYSWKKCKKIAA